MTPFRRKQVVGIASALPAFLVVGLTVEHANSLFAFVVLPADELSSRLAFALRWMLLPGVCLLVGVMVAGRRGFVADAIDGARTPTSHSLEINLRYNLNTLEQLSMGRFTMQARSVAFTASTRPTRSKLH